MLITTSLKPFRHGEQFRAQALRGSPDLLGPFLGVDHAWMSAPTFPLHSHTGMSAVSYLFLDSETGIHNHDSIGTRNLIRPGGMHWTTAGRGIQHEEVPAESGKTVHSLQIFVGLAPERQHIAPFALSLEPQDVPMVQLPGVTVRVPVGSFGDVRSPLKPPTDVTVLDISLDEGAVLTVPIAAGESAFIMPISGAVTVDGQDFDASELQLPISVAQDAPRAITLRAPRGRAQAVLFSGCPLLFSAT
ncbi:MAG: pirin family protein [Comamonas sp.]|jgi:redox-sensitive bicupin YhaK (pirin superfamily)|nr:pirin family protein [Comamonas sp.]